MRCGTLRLGSRGRFSRGRQPSKRELRPFLLPRRPLSYVSFPFLSIGGFEERSKIDVSKLRKDFVDVGWDERSYLSRPRGRWNKIDSCLEPKEETRDARMVSILFVRLLSLFVQEGRPSYRRTFPLLFVEKLRTIRIESSTKTRDAIRTKIRIRS